MVFQNIIRQINIILISVIILLSYSPYSYAQNNNDNKEDNLNDNESIDNESYDYDDFIDEQIQSYAEEELYVLDEMHVVETVGEGEDPGVTEISRDIIKAIPSGNQGITDMLKIAPGVQFSEDYGGASTAGEIKPGQISISGGNVYDNLFLIDGMSNSSLLDPANNKPNKGNDVAGDPQKFYISQWLIEDITLYDSDISSKYDGFLGGVVEAKIRKPGREFKGNISYKGTNNYLTNYFLSDDAKEDFKNGYQGNQLYFEKHFFSAALDIPITDKGGLLLSFSNNWSKIPLRSLNKWEVEERYISNFYAKGIYKFDSSSYIDFSLSYSPSFEIRFLPDKKDSEYLNIGGGVFGTINYVKEHDGHKFTVHGDGSYSENSKIAPNEMKNWIATHWTDKRKPRIDWGFESAYNDQDPILSSEGGHGSIKKEEIAGKLSFDHNVKSYTQGKYLKFKLNYGAQLTDSYGNYNRIEDAYNYTASEKRPVFCGDDNETCIEGDQYFTERKITPKSFTEANIFGIGAYGEFDLKLERFLFKIGGRISWDDYMNNVNFSPRVRLTLDLFNNKSTLLMGGYGRYYAASMMYYKLREARVPDVLEKRWTGSNNEQGTGGKNELNGWKPSSMISKYSYKFSDLNTPYSDEYSASINQKILGSFVNIKYIERHGKDNIAQNRDEIGADRVAYYTFNNNGTSLYRSVQIKWQKTWKNHSLMANITWSHSETSNDTYDQSLDVEDLEEVVFYKGEKIKQYELPKGNYARPVVFNATYVGRFFKHLKFSLTLKYKSPYTALEKVGDESLGYEELDENGNLVTKTASSYDDVLYGHNFTVDLGLFWEQQLYKDLKLTIFAEVYNLFNNKNSIGKRMYTEGSSQDYGLGTQVWFGANLEF